jgi:HSP20 family protein
MYTKFKKHPHFGNLEMVAPLFTNLIHEVFNAPINEVVKDQVKKHTTPAANIVEYANKYEITLAVPGFKKEDINISLEKNKLNISAEAKQDETKYKHREFGFSDIKRSFNLSDNINKEGIKASTTNGLLVITLNKAETAKPTVIDVQ